MPAPTPSHPQPRHPRTPGEILAMASAMLVAALALNAPAMLLSAEKMEFDAPARAPALRLLSPAATLSARLRLERLRAAAEAAERRWLEPPPPVFPAPAQEPDDAGLDDTDLDAFLP